MTSLMKKLNIGLFIFLVLAVGLSCFGLLNVTIPEGHDLTFHLARIESLSEGLRFGNFPVRIYPHYFKGYGYANGLMYPDLLLYPAALLCLTGMSVISSYKALILVYTALTAIFMYRTLIKITHHEWASRLGMLLYTVSVYRMVDVWTRAALGETLSFMFVPFIILGIYYIFFDDERQWYELTIGFSGIFVSHLLSGLMWAEMMVIICIIGCVKLFKEPRRLGSLIKATVAAVLLVSYSLFPMFEQLMSQEFRVSDNANYALNWVFPIQKLFFSTWIEGHPDHWFPGGVGISIVGIILLGILALRQENNKLAWGSVFISLLSLVMMANFFPWEFILTYIPMLGRLQFPWRLLMITTSFLVLAFSVFYSHSNRLGRGIGILIVAYSVLLGVRVEWETLTYYTSIQEDVLKRTVVEVNAVTDREYSVGNGEYVPLDVDLDTMYGHENWYTINQDIPYTAAQEGTTITIDFSGQTEPNLQIEGPLLYYKGYGAKMGNQYLEVTSGDNGAVLVKIPEVVGEGCIVISYEGTTLQHVTLGVSIISLIGFIVLIIRSKIKR